MACGDSSKGRFSMSVKTRPPCPPKKNKAVMPAISLGWSSRASSPPKASSFPSPARTLKPRYVPYPPIAKSTTDMLMAWNQWITNSGGDKKLMTGTPTALK